MGWGSGLRAAEQAAARLAFELRPGEWLQREW